jgi:DNA-binding NarL/FixJ family response regulator
MPRMTGIQAAAELSRRKPEMRTLMLSMSDSEQYLFEALKAGASGYVLKSGADEDIVDACRATMRGESFLYPSAMHTSKEIAEELVISFKTVERHRQNILDKARTARPRRAHPLRDPPRADSGIGPRGPPTLRASASSRAARISCRCASAQSRIAASGSRRV